MATKARQQYFADEISLQKDSREFSLEDNIKQKIDSVEVWAQVNTIETVKVNGTVLTPDANKAVNVLVPDVIDNLYSTSTDDALSAKQWKVLYDYIQNIASRWRFLSNWNSATGLPMTNPTENPYPYKAWDYYSVSNVASGWGTNYRPNGSSYIIWQASTTVETEEVNVSDFYLYDGTNWLLLVNTARQIAVDSSLSTTSTNPVENRVVTNAINWKQNTLTAGNHITISSDVISAVGFQESLTAWENITIGDECTTESDMKWPCPKGFHIPLRDEYLALTTACMSLWITTGSDFKKYLKLPVVWRITKEWNFVANASMYFLSDERNSWYGSIFYVSDMDTWSIENATALPLRPMKNIAVVPDNTWATLLDGSSVATWAWVFHNTTEWLISISADGTNWITIADKNIWATAVRNDGDAVTDLNGGSVFQWWNNYPFSRSWPTITSTTQVDASGYWPWNYYYSGTFIIAGVNWSSVWNNNLRWWQTHSTYQECIHNVISAVDTTYTAWTWINIDANNVISSTVSPWPTYTAGSWIDITNNVISADTTVVATQTDLASKQGTLTASTWINIDSSNNISNTLPWPTIAATAPTGTEWALWYDTTNDVLMAHDWTAWKEAWTQMKVLSYGNSTWQDFLDAYNENAIVYCRASSNSNPATWNQTRMAFMAYVNSATPTEVEFQYYRSRNDHNTAANQLDQVFVYKLTSASWWTWTVTERNTAAKAVAWTWISLTFGSGNMVIANTWVTSVNNNTWAVTVNEPVVSSSTPATPTEWMLWYDTTNDVLKTYDWSNWNECWAWWGIEIFPMYQYGWNTDWTDIIDSCANNDTLTILLDVWEDDYATQTWWVKWLVTEYDDWATSWTWRISAIALFNLNWVGSAVPYPKSNKLVATFNTTTKYCTGVTQYYTEFVPTNSWSTGNVLTKTAGWYEWAAPSGWDVVVSSQANNILTSWMKIWAWTESDYQNLWTYDSNTVYLTI